MITRLEELNKVIKDAQAKIAIVEQRIENGASYEEQLQMLHYNQMNWDRVVLANKEINKLINI